MKNFLLRPMIFSDCAALAEGFAQQGWHKTANQFQQYLSLQESNHHLVLVASIEDLPVGYLIIRPFAAEGPFADQSYPELADFNVLQKFQHQGIGSKLLDAAQKYCTDTLHAKTVTLAVGLHRGYGHAQRLYIKRGYLLDGSGAWYNGKPAQPYAKYDLDDDLVLYLFKDLSSNYEKK